MHKQFLFLLLFIFASHSCKQKQVSLTPEEVINVIRQFDDGWENKNLQRVDSVL